MDIQDQVQNQIKHTLGQPESLEQIRLLLKDDDVPSRIALTGELCELFGFMDFRGRRQLATCLKALRDLEQEGHFALPPPNFVRHTKPMPRRLPEAVPAPLEVPTAAGEVRGLALVLVETVPQIRIWNELMVREHPQGAGPLVGRQLRYLIASDHGWLGGLGFASAALTLADRDRWIGWDDVTRRNHLQRVVGMSRFLIRPMVHCKNLASQILGMTLRRLRVDFEQRYELEPLLVESFVDAEAFAGTCYQAANWVKVGRTQGRGRQDRQWARPATVKEIYVYPLRPDFRRLIGVAEPEGLAPLETTEGLDGPAWADHEFSGAPLGDKRLSERLVASARALAEQPGVSFSGLEKENWSAVKGYYRMIDQPNDSEVTLEAILAPHQQRTVQRMMGHPTVLCIQDGSDLNYSDLEDCEGLGPMGSNQRVSYDGLHLHSMLAVTATGLPLGVLDAKCYAQEPKAQDDTRYSTAIPIEEKRTFNWLLGVRKCIELAPQLPDTHLVCVMDREADIFELFDEQRLKRRVDLLVRAKHDRRLGEGRNLFETIRQSPERARLKIQIPRHSARRKKGDRKATDRMPQREADVGLHYQSIDLRPPDYMRKKDPVRLWVVHVREEQPPEGIKPLEWLLLTTQEVATTEDAKACLGWYALRWRIEDWHRVLKTGCRVEELAHKTAERLKRAVAINLVIAWRIMLMTLLGRESPELPAEILFADFEIRVLKAIALQRRLAAPTNLGTAVQLVARLGGYLARKKDPPPGHEIMWRGFSILQIMTQGFALGAGG